MFNANALMAIKILAFATWRRDLAEDVNPKALPDDYTWQAPELKVRFPAGHRKYEATLQELRRIGWIASKRGPDGGYWLTDKGAAITGYEIADIYASEINRPYLTVLGPILTGMTPANMIEMREAHMKNTNANRLNPSALCA